MNNRYFIRAGKYCIYLTVLIIILFGLMNLYNPRPLAELYWGNRGLMLLILIIVFSLTYPLFGFTKKTLTFDATKKVEDIERIMTMSGYARVSGTADNAMVFRATSTPKKLMSMWEDSITINTVDGLSTIVGIRKEVVKATFRFGTYIS